MFTLELHNKLYNLVRDGGVQLQLIGKDGEQLNLSQGFGVGVRQHDDVMLAFNYSRVTRFEQSLTTGQFMVLRLDINSIQLHHAESRILSSSAGSLRVKFYDATGNENLFPATPTQMSIYNKQFLVKETSGVNVMAEFNSHPAQGTDPFITLEAIENRPLRATALGGVVKASAIDFESISGRHYPANKTYALVIENIGPETTSVYYQYNFHEIPIGGEY